jgi:hypothetical protein
MNSTTNASSKRREQIRYNLGEDEFLKWEAAEDAAHDADEMTDDERDEMEEETRAAWFAAMPQN